jgi:AraC-like DNA-binding protein
LVKAHWRLAAGWDGPEWTEHRAVPDGCVEVIRRASGRSRWGGAQPTSFVVGLIDAAASFEIGRGSRFAALRLWPWTWSLIGDVPLVEIKGRWAAIESPWLLALSERLDDPAEAEALLSDRLSGAGQELGRIGRAIVASQSVAGMQRATGMDARTLQRWFARHVGLPPRAFLRLLRFERAFAGAVSGASLADHAVAHGFADQAHMAREYRRLAGAPARTARRTSKGPFLR